MADQLALALNARHEGQDANLAAGSKGYRDDRTRVEVAVATLARKRTESGRAVPFNADSVHEEIKRVSKEPYDRNIVSSVMGTWAKEGRIREYVRRRPVRSANATRHASKNPWRIGVEDVHEEVSA